METRTWLLPHILSLFSARCDICCVTFRTHRGLLRHNALVHKQLPRDAMGRPFIQNNPSIPAGFHDLGFTDFSCRKFPRISQVFCSACGPSSHLRGRVVGLAPPPPTLMLSFLKTLSVGFCLFFFFLSRPFFLKFSLILSVFSEWVIELRRIGELLFCIEFLMNLYVSSSPVLFAHSWGIWI